MTVPLSLAIEVDASNVGHAFDELGDTIEREARVAMREATEVVAERARQTGTFVDRSGQLRASIQPSDPPVTGTFFDGSLEGSVGFGATSGGDTEQGDGGKPFPYGLALEFGSVPHEIKPRRFRWLRFPSGDRFVYARKVNHPGTSARHFMRDALAGSAADIERAFAEAIDDALTSAGFR